MKRLLPLLALTLLPACSYLGLSDSGDETAMAPAAEAELAPVPAPTGEAAVPTPLATPQAALAVADAWVAPTPKGAKVAAGFFTVGNAGVEEDRIVAAASPRATRIELRETSTVGGKAKTLPVKGGIQIPAVGTITLKPDGLHLAFIGIKEPFIEGQTIPVTLTFEKAGPIEIALTVKAQGAIGAQH
jgi:copper(I)-binding protein